MVELLSNPYEGVDWSSISVHRANLHGHSDRQHGERFESAIPPQEHIEEYKRQTDTTVLAITDRAFSDIQDPPEPTYPWGDFESMDGPNSESYENVSPEEVGLIPVLGRENQNDSEGNGIHHVITLFTDYGSSLDASNATSELEVFEELQEWEDGRFVDTWKEYDPIAWLAHPGRYHNANEWESYLDHFNAGSHVIGLEIWNQGLSRYDRNDEKLWDVLLSNLMPDRPIYALGVDDGHCWEEGNDFDMAHVQLLLSDCSAEAVHRSLQNGWFHAARHDPVGAIAPTINFVDVDRDEQVITVNADDYETIEWISNGDVIHHGRSLPYGKMEIYNYARAVAKSGTGGETTTQAFGFPSKDIEWTFQLSRKPLRTLPKRAAKAILSRFP
ncbi:hypothetical protein [Natronococcus sp. A-GB7]|uniref:hypothetical protein n=1 Tax=Natronococcus sp. A-GB7 TaxID=3037649 RepID=UPI00241C90AE|nr:hypothetical protein [Natronococcus sp. A-GB7]MDG5821293.1 hypothetical protein [Natronococcus sp. A-GB7]